MVDGRYDFSQARPERTHKIELVINVSAETDNKIAGLARWIKGDYGDVLKRALALLEVAVHAIKEGQKICITDQQYNVVAEITSISI